MCVCVCVRERQGETGRVSERVWERDTGWDREREGKRERVIARECGVYVCGKTNLYVCRHLV